MNAEYIAIAIACLLSFCVGWWTRGYKARPRLEMSPWTKKV